VHPLVFVASVVVVVEVPLPVPELTVAPVPLVVLAPLVAVVPLEAPLLLCAPASGGIVKVQIELFILHVAPRLMHLQFASVVHHPSMP
jgi:hypothetical protein